MRVSELASDNRRALKPRSHYRQEPANHTEIMFHHRSNLVFIPPQQYGRTETPVDEHSHAEKDYEMVHKEESTSLPKVSFDQENPGRVESDSI